MIDEEWVEFQNIGPDYLEFYIHLLPFYVNTRSTLLDQGTFATGYCLQGIRHLGGDRLFCTNDSLKNRPFLHFSDQITETLNKEVL